MDSVNTTRYKHCIQLCCAVLKFMDICCVYVDEINLKRRHCPCWCYNWRFVLCVKSARASDATVCLYGCQAVNHTGASLVQAPSFVEQGWKPCFDPTVYCAILYTVPCSSSSNVWFMLPGEFKAGFLLLEPWDKTTQEDKIHHWWCPDVRIT